MAQGGGNFHKIFKARIEDYTADNSNADLVVIGGTAQTHIPLPINFIIEPMVTFYPDLLRLVVPCDVPNCQGHYKYGVYREKNMPVVYGHHKKDVAYYFSHGIKATHPIQVPHTTGRLIDGIKWYSATPRDGQIGLRMTCMIDGFLTDLKVRTLDKSFCMGCLFISKDYEGRKLERVIRTIMLYIYAVAKPEPGPDGVHQVIREFSYEQQLFIKRIWIDRLYDSYELREELQHEMRGNSVLQSLVNDLSYDPIDSSRHMMVRMTQFRFVIENLLPVAVFTADALCGCGYSYHRSFNILRFQAIRVLQGWHIGVEAAYFTFNAQTLEFDEDYWEYGGAERDTALTNNLYRNLSKKVEGSHCTICDQPVHLENYGVPETTWILVVEVPNVYRINMKHTQLPEAIVLSGSSFELAWVSFLKSSDHYVSLHRFDNHWFFYDDIAGGNGGVACPFNRLDGAWFQAHRMDYTMERAFYLRTAQRNPHRCLIQSHIYDEEILAAQINAQQNA